MKLTFGVLLTRSGGQLSKVREKVKFHEISDLVIYAKAVNVDAADAFQV